MIIKKKLKEVKVEESKIATITQKTVCQKRDFSNFLANIENDSKHSNLKTYLKAIEQSPELCILKKGQVRQVLEVKKIIQTPPRMQSPKVKIPQFNYDSIDQLALAEHLQRAVKDILQLAKESQEETALRFTYVKVSNKRPLQDKNQIVTKQMKAHQQPKQQQRFIRPTRRRPYSIR